MIVSFVSEIEALLNFGSTLALLKDCWESSKHESSDGPDLDTESFLKKVKKEMVGAINWT